MQTESFAFPLSELLPQKVSKTSSFLYSAGEFPKEACRVLSVMGTPEWGSKGPAGVRWHLTRA